MTANGSNPLIGPRLSGFHTATSRRRAFSTAARDATSRSTVIPQARSVCRSTSSASWVAHPAFARGRSRHSLRSCGMSAWGDVASRAASSQKHRPGSLRFGIPGGHGAIGDDLVDIGVARAQRAPRTTPCRSPVSPPTTAVALPLTSPPQPATPSSPPRACDRRTLLSLHSRAAHSRAASSGACRRG